MADELTMATWKEADDASPGPVRLWLLARCPAEARRLAVATQWDHDDGAEAESGWTVRDTEHVDLAPKSIVGVWAAPHAELGEPATGTREEQIMVAMAVAAALNSAVGQIVGVADVEVTMTWIGLDPAEDAAVMMGGEFPSCVASVVARHARSE